MQVLDSLPARVERLELATGQRSPWRSFQPSNLGGLTGLSAIIFSADMDGYAYNYESIVSDLYTLDGAV